MFKPIGRGAYAATMLLIAIPVSAAQSSAPLLPASAWEIETAPVACHLGRSFGAGEKRVQIGLRRTIYKAPMRWTLAYENGEAAQQNLSVDVEKLPQQSQSTFPAVQGQLADSGKYYLAWRDHEPDAAFTDDQILTISTSGGQRWSMQASAMARAIAALDKCVDDGRKALRFNDNIAVRPEPSTNPGEWATDADYPSQSRRNKDEGIAHFMVLISNEGLVTGCHIIESSGFPALDSKTCDLMRERAKFHPAKDANGAPIHSQYSNRVSWKLPEWQK